jgi:lipopolysaccharide/colanic/teichoic acid biosynthesis glycosyltransferase
MSLVGPRPALPSEVAQFDPELRDRLKVKPGLTGLWQVSERGNGKVMWQSTTPDVVYVRTVSLRTDLSILARTVPALLARLVASVFSRHHSAEGASVPMS